MKIVFFEVPKEEQVIFAGLLSGSEVLFYEEKLNIDNAEKAKDAEIISVFINSVVNKDIIDKMPNLRYITTRSTGFDHIDKEYCLEKGIQVSNVPTYGSRTVAEYAYSLLLALSRKVYNAAHQLKEEGDFNIFSFQGMDLYGKTIGVIGTGKIGKNSIKIAKGFGMSVVAYDLFPDINFAKEVGFEYKNLNELLSVSDVITIHAPYTKDNHHLINKETILKMKKGVFLINTARGELVDTDALIFGLKEKIISAAGLDVLEGERELKEELEILSDESRREKIKDYRTLFEDRVLIDMPNVIVTPHIAFYSKEAQGEIIKTTVDNIKTFMSGSTQNLIK